jgi:putative addiction module component (TIGR02574 family)
MTTMIDRNAIRGLSVAERLLLVEEIWDSIPLDGEGIPLTDAQRRELDVRLERMVREPDAGSTWDEVKARLRFRR